MKNIIEILKDLGLEVPSDKTDALNRAVSENYKTNAEHDKKITRLEADRDNWKEQAEKATETLKGFEGKDFDAIQRERDEWKDKADKAQKEYESKIYERDFADALEKEVASLKFTSESAKKAVLDEIKNAGLKLSDGKILGLNDLITQIKSKDEGAFVNEEKQKLEDGKAKFTGSMKHENNNVTKESIMAIKNREERQRAMLDNRELFGI